MKRLTIVTVLAALGLATGTAAADHYGPRHGPPASREHVRPMRAGHVWIPGHWQWTGWDYSWVPGHYERARIGYVYMPGWWSNQGGRHHWVAGRWERDRHARDHHDRSRDRGRDRDRVRDRDRDRDHRGDRDRRGRGGRRGRR